MSEYDDYGDEAVEAYWPEPVTPESQLTELFHQDPSGTIAAIAGAAAELRANQLAQETHGRLQQIDNQYSSAVSEQSAAMALRRMQETYGAEWEGSKLAVAEYLQQRPYLQNSGLQDPNVALDVLDGAFQNVRANVRQEADRNEWNRVKDIGRLEYGDKS